METANVINELRKKVQVLSKKAHSLNQAVKALSGIGTDAEKKALGVKNFSLAEVKAAWHPSLLQDEKMGLFMKSSYTTTIDEKEVRLYERTEGKKGVVYRALSVRKLQVPEEWTPELIIEGLVQSRLYDLAVEEAKDSVDHIEKVAEFYKKVTKKDENGFMAVTFEEVDAE